MGICPQLSHLIPEWLTSGGLGLTRSKPALPLVCIAIFLLFIVLVLLVVSLIK